MPVGSATTVIYGYDAVYNRTGETVLDASGTTVKDLGYQYNNRNQLTQVRDNLDPSQSITYRFDANGNQTGKNQAGITTTFVYDVRDHLRQVTQGGSTVGQFLYDYRGLRVEKQGARGTERYSYDDTSVLTQFDASGATLAKYEYGGDRLLSLNHFGDGVQFYHFDALGSPVTLTKPDGTTQARYAYDAWGHVRHQSGTSWNRFGFTGHEHDQETGLIYAKARYYDADTGRFLSQDPWAGDINIAPSLNKYLYAYMNPTVYVDPDGREAVDFFEGLINAPLNLMFGGQMDPFDLMLLQKEQPERFAQLSAQAQQGGFLDQRGIEKSFNVDLRNFSISTDYHLGASTKESLISTFTFGIPDAGEAIGNTAGAVAVTFGDYPQDIKNQADNEIGGATFAVAAAGITHKVAKVAQAKAAPKIAIENPQGIGSLQARADAEAGLPYQHPIKEMVVRPPVTGETTSTAIGKQVHKAQADRRRASGLFNIVEQPIKDKAGDAILVPKRVDLKTGLPQQGTPLQQAVPDAVSFDRKLIIDDKPLGRPIAKDRQEIIRFIEAYKMREGVLPDKIGIQRYDSTTGKPVRTDLHSPYEFLPKKE